ncbi:MAG TPA: zinc-dependent alcohol dehydrogenase family protein [Gammaproteobacteria bacterium]|nr:zinc-dependent alcohol dehydrogenase family protein [Gammaproteobacteria bacterium]
MQAMLLRAQGQPLEPADCPLPSCAAEEILIKVHACAVCRTDLHVCDGDLKDPDLPLIPGHEIVGEVVASGKDVSGYTEGQRVGVPWLGYTCGQCDFCRQGQENLCDKARFTGYQIDGGYAEYTVAHQQYVFSLPDSMDDIHVAPLLCAGLIGYRAFAMAGRAHRIGMYGFGAAAHIITQVACSQGCEVYAFTRAGDSEGQAFARKLGAVWAGSSEEPPPALLDAAIIFAPVGELLPLALRATRKGGSVVCAGIHMSDIPSFPYNILWGERSVKSVANLTRADGEAFFKIIESIPVHTEVTTFPLTEANTALNQLRSGKLQGAAVLVIQDN